jgi:hypothetical protein
VCRESARFLEVVMLIRRALLWTALILLGTASLALAQVRQTGGISGRLTDESGAALPGVTVSITCAGSSGIIATVTGGAGEYAVSGLPSGLCTVEFELAGFVTATHGNIAVPPQQVVVVNEQLGLAVVEETVNVVAQAPPVRATFVPKPRPRVQAAAVVAHDIDSVCGPGRPSGGPTAVARLAGLREDGERTLFAPGDAIMLDAGSADGLAVGQNFVVRRSYRPSDFLLDAAAIPTGVHSAGLVQVVEVTDASAVVAVVYACDAFVVGDWLEAFTPEPLPVPKADGEPDFDKPARVLFGDESRMLGAPGRLMVIDQGQNAGLEAGQRITLFRPSRFGRAGVSRIGDAVIVTVRADWARIRIDSVHDVVFAGDQAAPHRPASTSRKRVQ